MFSKIWDLIVKGGACKGILPHPLDVVFFLPKKNTKKKIKQKDKKK